VGSIGLFPPRDGYAEAGYWTAPGCHGRGFTAEALALLYARLATDPRPAG
jgi:RimJ/RimL family protein N-acetyltransferase